MTDLNYHTEDEARQLWCRHVRMTHWDGDNLRGTYNRMNDENCEGGTRVQADCRCIASRCMSWRWRDEGRTHGYCAVDGNPDPQPGQVRMEMDPRARWMTNIYGGDR